MKSPRGPATVFPPKARRAEADSQATHSRLLSRTGARDAERRRRTTSPAPPVLSVTDVSFGYASARGGAEAFALQNVTLDVRHGSVTALLGPNGCGKTTLLKLLHGVLQPQQGVITLHGAPLGSRTRRELARAVAVVPQETHPAFDYTAAEMVLMGRHPHLGAFQLEGPADLAIAQEAMSATGTAHLWHRSYGTLSGGEKQRVIIASAIAQEPSVLLLDEPTASLDLGYQLEVAALLRRLQRERGMTMVLATHDLNLAASLSDHVVMLREGSVTADGPPDQVLTPAQIARLYAVDADVTFHARAGHLTITPVQRTR